MVRLKHSNVYVFFSLPNHIYKQTAEVEKYHKIISTADNPIKNIFQLEISDHRH